MKKTGMNLKVSKRSAAKKSLIISLAAVVIIAGAGIAYTLLQRTYAAQQTAAHDGVSGHARHNKAAAIDRTQYERELKDAVDTPAGAPRDGRDPSLQGQSSLAAVASSPTGAGRRTDKPAAGVVGDHSRRVNPEEVLDHSNHGSVASNGCVVGYGKPGEQCLPTRCEGKAITCDHVRKHFPKGVSLTGKDTYKLDKNRDKIACNKAD